ncbi:mitochondrial inner membrane protease subunit 2 isoform X9 [Taeniopygia guttata]|uniref:mitochondrial inner membrane protease subunit 2 isoform X9 n=1 Tax=Taeniopygia guttata TaxID=59729 RepID=UPI0011AF901F|nr:mitochondrial inner membrane protease subunit 2 isoform X4 [Taeniopygia guttata]
MAQAQGLGRRYIKAFFKGFFVAVPVTVTFLDRVACVARVEGASMQVFLEISFVYQEIKRCLFTDNSKPSLNPGGREASDVVLLNHWSIRNYDVQRGDIVSLVSPRNPEQKIIKRVIALEGDIIKFLLDFYMPEPLIFSGLHNAGRSYSRCFLRSANHSTGSRSDLNAQA